MSGGGIETKVAAGSVTYLAAGYLSGLLVEIVPWLRDNLTADQKQNLPVIIAWLLGAVAAYFSPHTHRPDLAPVQPPEGEAPPPSLPGS